MGIVAHTKFNGERKQAQSFECGMLYQTPAKNYAKENNNQCANCGQYVFHIVCCYRFIRLKKMHIENAYPRIRIIRFKSHIEFPLT